MARIRRIQLAHASGLGARGPHAAGVRAARPRRSRSHACSSRATRRELFAALAPGRPRPASTGSSNGVDVAHFRPVAPSANPFAGRPRDRVHRRHGLPPECRGDGLVRQQVMPRLRRARRAPSSRSSAPTRPAVLEPRRMPDVRVTGRVPDVAAVPGACRGRGGAAAHRARHSEQGSGGDGDGEPVVATPQALEGVRAGRVRTFSSLRARRGRPSLSRRCWTGAIRVSGRLHGGRSSWRMIGRRP